MSTLMQAVLALISAESEAERKRVLETQRDVLLTDKAEQLLNEWLAKSEGSYASALQECLALLARRGKEGIENLRQKRPRPSKEKVRQAIFALVEADSAKQRQQLIQQQQDILFSDAADDFLAQWIKDVENFEEDDVIRHLRECRTLLAKCRDEGIEAAFARQAPPDSPTPELLALLNEIQHLNDPQQMPRRIETCRQALALVAREAQPQLWAALQGELGNSLAQNPLGNHADNLEEAIRNYRVALTIYTRQAFPYHWAHTMNNLATAYSERIRGNRADNLEEAIKHATETLTVYTPQTFPSEWARTTNNLANVYGIRIKGTRADNLEEAIKYATQALTVYTPEAFPHEWAMTMGNLGNTYVDRVRGVRANNLEQAIRNYRQVLTVYTRQAFPQGWAMTMGNLANAYFERIRESRADNLEEAIRNYKQALTVYTRQAFPQGWAMTMGNLANVYSERILGIRADNLEEAIKYATQALTIYTRPSFPEGWAASMNTLALAYFDRIQGRRADNLEEAIKHATQALTVYTRQAFPEKWAMTMNSLTLAYLNRIRGERADNLEEAIKHASQALTVYTHQAFPFEWAGTMNNLAHAYSKRTRGARADNLEEAIKRMTQALTVYTPQAFPVRWASTMQNLAAAYLGRIRGTRADNLEEAIKHATQALTVHTRQAFPYDWASTMNNLAIVYFERIRGGRADNLEKVISHCTQALTVRTREAFPYEWAQTMDTLATTYSKRIQGTRADNLSEAIRNYRQALAVRTPDTLPQDCRSTAYALGHLFYDEGRFTEAREALVTAHKAVEALRGEVVREEARRKLAEENADLYARLVFCCLHDADEKAAFEYAAAGKGRVFVDLLASARFDLSTLSAEDDTFAKDWQQHQEIRQEINDLLNLLSGKPSLPEKTDEKLDRQKVRAHLGTKLQLRAKQRKALELWEELSYNYPALTATQSAPSLTLEQAQQVATKLDAILVEYFLHAEGWCAFVVTKDALRHVPLPKITNQFLKDMVIGWESSNDPALQNQVYWTLEEWYEVLITPLTLPEKGRLLLAPASDLHLIPLAIARHPESLNYLYEQYDLTFAPNLSMVRVTLAEAKKVTDTITGTLLTVAYPSTGKRLLKAVIPEAYAVASHFAKSTKLHHQQATPEAVIKHAPQKEVVHFSCHAGFDRRHPTESGFELFKGYLTVQQIITQLRLKETVLATLSACQTHRAKLEAGDELTGLTQALMVAGAKSIVASLWSVEERSTRALFEHFYQAIAKGEAPAIALKQAMQHVRQQPGWEHPFYWAAFQVSGLGFDLDW